MRVVCFHTEHGPIAYHMNIHNVALSPSHAVLLHTVWRLYIYFFSGHFVYLLIVALWHQCSVIFLNLVVDN